MKQLNISTINRFFARLGGAQIKHRFLILLIFAALTVAFGSGLTRLKISGNSDGWYGDSDQIKIDKRHYNEIFGNTDMVAVLVLSDDVFKPEVLRAVDEMSRRLEKGCPFADRVTSLTRVDVPRGTEDGFEIVNPFGNGIPDNPDELKAKKDFIMSRSSLVNTLVSDDARETFVSLSLHPFDPALDRDEQAETVGNFMIDLLSDPAFKSDAYEIHGIGLPYTDLVQANFDDEETAKSVIIAGIVMLIVLAFFTRSVVGVLVPSLATICAIAASLGFMAYCGETADESLFIVPVFLGMALSVGYSIHYINMFKMKFAASGKRKEAAVYSVENSGWAIFFTVVTTIASLISFIFAGLKPISWLGRSSSLVVFSVYVYTAALVPIFLSFGKDKAVSESPSAEGKDGTTALDRYFEGFADLVYKRKVAIIAVTFLVFAAMIPGILRIHIDMDMIAMNGNRVPYVQDILKIMRTKLGNIYSYSVMIEYEDDEAFKDVERMKNLEELERRIGALNLTKKSNGKPRVTSVTSVIKEFYRAFNEDDVAFFAVPEEDFVLSQVMEFCSIDMHKDFSDFMDDDFKVATVNVDMAQFNSKAGLADIASLKADLAELFPDAHCSIIGDMIEYSEMTDRLTFGEVKSLLFSFVIIAALLMLAFMSIRTGLIAMLPNIAPVIVVGGIIGYLGIPLDLTTMTVGPIILGIAVDDTIHLNNHVKLLFGKCGGYKEATRVSFREIGKSMFQTTVTLCAMFIVLTSSLLRYIVILGGLLSVGLAVALIADYTVTPALIFLTKPFGRERPQSGKNSPVDCF